MAFTPLVPVTGILNASLAGDMSYKLGPVKNAAGTAVNLSAWVSMGCSVFPANSVLANPATALALANAPVGDSSGNITGEIQQGEVAGTLIPGAAMKFAIFGKPTSGDELQTLATGTFNLNI